jgi:outer membrane protein
MPMLLGMGLNAMAAERLHNLDSAYQLALAADRLYKSAEAQHRATLEKLPQARAGLLPTVSVSANRMNYDAQVDYQNNRFQDINRQFLVNGWTLSVTQPLFRMSSILQYGRAELQVEHAHIALGLARHDLLLRTVKAFAEWQSALRGVQAAEANRKYLRELERQVQSEHALQRATKPMSLDAQARAAKAEADYQEAHTELRAKSAALSKILGVPLDGVVFSFGLDKWPELSGPVEQWLAQAGEMNGQIRGQELLLAMAEKDVAAARAGHLPTLNLVANKNHTYNSGSTSIVDGSSANMQNQSGIGLQLEVPIFAGGMVTSRTSEALALRDKAREDLENTRGAVEVDIQTFYSKVHSGIAQIKAAELRIEAAKSKLAEALYAKKLGMKLEVDVLEADAAWHSAQREFFAAQSGTMIALLQLRLASGELSEKDVSDWSRLLIPNHDLKTVSFLTPTSVIELPRLQ